MSSDDAVALSRRSLVRGLSLLLAAAPALSACGDGGIQAALWRRASGAGLQERMAQVDFRRFRAGSGQRIRNELIFLTTGGGHPLPPTHRLEVMIRESVISTLVRIDGESLGQIYSVQASFRLISIKDKKVVLQGSAMPAPVSSGSRRSIPTCAHARTPRTARRAPSPTTSRRGSRRICPARRETVPLPDGKKSA